MVNSHLRNMENSNEKSKGICGAVIYSKDNTANAVCAVVNCQTHKPSVTESEDIDINKGIELALSAPFPQVAIHWILRGYKRSY
jgi:hypothetical protein